MHSGLNPMRTYQIQLTSSSKSHGVNPKMLLNQSQKQWSTIHPGMFPLTPPSSLKRYSVIIVIAGSTSHYQKMVYTSIPKIAENMSSLGVVISRVAPDIQNGSPKSMMIWRIILIGLWSCPVKTAMKSKVSILNLVSSNQASSKFGNLK